MIITTTQSVEGYNITRYIGTVTGAATYSPGGIIGEGFLNKHQSAQFAFAWQEAVEFMKKAAGRADAIIGVQHTLCGVANGYMVVSVAGTAVMLEENPMHKKQLEQAKQEEEQRRQEELRREQEKEQEAREKREQYFKTHEIQYATNPNGEKAVYPIPSDKADFVLCPLCRERQRAGRHICMKCGTPFMFE